MYFQDNSGFLDFREYLIGLALVSQPGKIEEVMEAAFQVSDGTQALKEVFVKAKSLRLKDAV